ncbi:Protein M60.2 [Aphelenchoides avenae]|nr:Protein M60.2 [Aphelenchus avenae]
MLLGKADPHFDTFYQTMFQQWYGTYTRCKNEGSPLGSSGWEHVYSGEQRQGEVYGQHNWVRYYRLEKAREINYHGYYSHDADLIGTFQYTWGDTMKEEGGFLISTSLGEYIK